MTQTRTQNGWLRTQDGIWPMFFYRVDRHGLKICVTKLEHRSWSWSVSYGPRGKASSEVEAKSAALMAAGA